MTATDSRMHPKAKRRARLLGMLDTVAVHPLTDEMRGLASRYVDRGVFTAGMFADALHVAAAVLLEQEVLVSWNFKHLVNRRRRAQVNEINILSGLPTVEIVAPPEM